MNTREKEEYLREYSILKSQGKPFFPYAVAKDSLMAVVVMISIIGMSLVLGAELGPKVDPTTTTYTPRPEWYFFFLFEVLRVIKPPSLTPLAAIGVPTICMILLFLLPFYDRGPERRPERRPIAMAAAFFTIAAMAFLTYEGANAGSPNQIDMEAPEAVVAAGPENLRQWESGKQVVAQSGCLACHKIGHNGGTLGPDLSTIGERLARQAIARTLVNPTAPMPAYTDLTPKKRDDLVEFLAQLKSGSRFRRQPPPSDKGTLQEPQVRAMFDRIAGFYDVMNSVMTAGLHHTWRRRAVDLARVGPGDRVLDVATGTGDLALELAARVAPGGEVIASDFSEEMLTRARTKGGGAPVPVTFEWANAMQLPYADGEFATATVGFGARNFSDLDRGLAEMARVVRPGGTVVVLEITTPTRPPLSGFYRLWFDRVVPLIGKVAGDPQAYEYLPNSVKRFPAPAELAARMDLCGLDVRYILTAGGIIALHAGTKR